MCLQECEVQLDQLRRVVAEAHAAMADCQEAFGGMVEVRAVLFIAGGVFAVVSLARITWDLTYEHRRPFPLDRLISDHFV